MKIVKKISIFALLFISLLSVGLLNVNAETAPSTITMKSKSSLYYYTEKKGTDYISGYNFYRKELTDGTIGYCVSNINTTVPGGKTLSSCGPITDMGLDYIIKNGFPNKSFTKDDKKDFYITQSAIWAYFDATRGSKNWKNTKFTASSTGMKAYVYQLVQGAKAAKNTGQPTSSVSISINNTKMNLSTDKQYFVSNVINDNASNTKDTYTVNLVKAPNGTTVRSAKGEVKTTFSKGEGFVVYVPVSSVSEGTGCVVLSINIQGVLYRTYYYTTGKSGYQDIAPVKVYEEIKDLKSNQLTLTYEKEKKIVTKVKISKQDITSKAELPGATLIIKDKSGKEVARWVSEKTPHYIEGLAAGEYTLTEISAPSGYVKSEETINFTVNANGVETQVIMFNAKEKENTKYKISKQDITSKEELPGAKLTIKDKNGKVVTSWTSGKEPHYVTNLAVGDYTLTEENAPKGYVLSKETIKFTVQKDGQVKTVVMFNEKAVTKVKISKQDITSKEELPGAKLTIKDKDGKEVASWVSEKEPHYIEGLAAGEYTLTETTAPEGYILSEETIKFVVKDDGTVTSVVMYNARKTEVTKVKISKQDFTTKEELPGATLTIKDKDGKVVETWVSGKTPHYIEGLAAGDYTLTETTAPEGYQLSSETINFTVKADGSVTSVVMYNARTVEVPITDLDINMTTIIGAAILVLFGTGLVFYAKRSY